jgi:hypothetical protein
MSENVTAPVTPAEATPSAPASPVATPQAPQAAAIPAAPAMQPATPAAPEVEPSWLRGRLNEVRQAAVRQANEQFAQREAQLRAEAERYRQQLFSVVGATPQNSDPEADAIKSQFYKIFPEAKELLENAKDILALRENAGNWESQNEHYWQSYGRQTVDRLFSKASEAIGAPLTDDAKRFLHSSFVGYVQSSPELQERYATDPTIVEDYLRMFSSSVIDPSRRQAGAAVVARAPQGLPQDSPSGAPQIPGAPKPKDLDERAALGWAQLQAVRGGQ